MRCECGMEVKVVGKAHLNGAPHRCAMTERRAEALGLSDPAPHQLWSRYSDRMAELGATAALTWVKTYQKGFVNKAHTENDRAYCSPMVASAIYRQGIPRGMGGPEFEAQAGEDCAMQIALTLVELYGDDATLVWWKVAVLNEDAGARQGVIDALRANGAAHDRWALGWFHKHAFDALLVVEAERVTLLKKKLAEAEVRPEAVAEQSVAA